jgi:hypothetical protein
MARLAPPPKPPRKWAEIKDWIVKELCPWLQESQVVESETVQIHQSPSGRLPLPIFPLQKGQNKRGLNVPWQTSVQTPSEGVYEVHVAPGVVNELLPSNIFDAFDVSAPGTYYVKCKCDSDGIVPNNLTIVIENSPIDSDNFTFENAAPPTFYLAIAVVVMTAAPTGGALIPTIFQITQTNIIAYPQVFMLISQTPSQPGMNYL